MGVGLIRHLMACYRREELDTAQVAVELGISSRRVRQLYSTYLRACVAGQEAQWQPGKSGGNRGRQIPPAVEVLWRRLFGARPPASYSFAASEAYRRESFRIDRATVRRWALEQGVGQVKPLRRAARAVRRWQANQIGALWQLDATTHRWFGAEQPAYPMLEMLDDCSRVITGARLYRSEMLLAYYEFLPRAFDTYGLPLVLYVDHHSFFFAQLPEALTDLGQSLAFYDISFRYASTPQAKGKIERHHGFWQNRLPTAFSAEGIGELSAANLLLDELRRHHNETEIHRELDHTPAAAWKAALRAGRSCLRPRPRCPWWPYIWSMRTTVRVSAEGYVHCGPHQVKPGEFFGPGFKLVHCTHPDGSFTLLARPPSSDRRPQIVYRIEAPQLRTETSTHTKRKV